MAHPGSGGPWGWRSLGVADPGSGGTWEWRNLGVVNPGSGGPWEWRTLTPSPCALLWFDFYASEAPDSNVPLAQWWPDFEFPQRATTWATTPSRHGARSSILYWPDVSATALDQHSAPVQARSAVHWRSAAGPRVAKCGLQSSHIGAPLISPLVATVGKM